jgi:hypothetical protein
LCRAPARAEYVDEGTLTWVETGDLTSLEGHASAFALPDGNAVRVSDHIEIYDPGTNQWNTTEWTTTEETSEWLWDATGARLTDGRILFVGKRAALFGKRPPRATTASLQ